MDDRKYLFACPHCKREIGFNRSFYDRRIADLQKELSVIRILISELKQARKRNPDFQIMRYQSLQKEAKYKENEIREIKEVRKAGCHVINDLIEKNFKRLVKEKIGEKAYIELRKQAEAELEDYSMKDVMHVDYTRKGGKKISKL